MQYSQVRRRGVNEVLMKETGILLLKQLKKEKRHKQTVGFLGDGGHYVYETDLVGDVSDALTRSERSIYALAIVDFEMKVKGLLLTRELYSMMGRQFGRAIMSKKMVGEIGREYRSFDYRQNIFSVESKFSDGNNENEVEYYILQDEKNHYKGIFSSRDLLIYLSNITRNDIEMARNIQRRISREESSIHEVKFDLVASTRAAKGVGGDYYSLLKSHGDHWIISVCDVSGKGISASLLTSTIWGMMSIYDFRKGLPAFLHKVNNYIYNTFESEKFITGIFMDFNAKTGEVQLCDMGHSYLFLHRKGRFRKMDVQGNLPIGVAPSEKLTLTRLNLKPEDYLFIPTDGLLEQENNLKELYPASNIGTIINAHHHRPIEEINQKIQDHFFDFKGEEHLHDDVTYLLLKYYEKVEDNYPLPEPT